MRQFLRVVFGLNVVFLVMLAIAYPYLEPGSESYVVTGLSLVVISVTMVASGVLLYLDWEPNDRGDWRDHLRSEGDDEGPARERD